jgi:hypothetical protein
MPGSSTSLSRFGVYNFFSVLLPGVLFIFGLYPLFPKQVDATSIGILLPLLAIGFTIGQLFHIVSVGIERKLDIDGHRDILKTELCTPSHLSEDTIEKFLTVCAENADGITLYGDGTETGTLDESTLDTATIDTLYVRVRAVVDFDGRGRTQTFQSIYSFCRSIYTVSVGLTLIYLFYGILLAADGGISATEVGVLPYEPKIQLLHLSPIMVLGLALALTVSSMTTFRHARHEYQKFFIQYLITEFLLLSLEESLLPQDPGVAAMANQPAGANERIK